MGEFGGSLRRCLRSWRFIELSRFFIADFPCGYAHPWRALDRLWGGLRVDSVRTVINIAHQNDSSFEWDCMKRCTYY